MPLFHNKRKVSGTGIDYKARLEHKLYLARENPEPVFDLSACELKNVPSGIYSLCKVFRKEALYLQDNQLISLNGGGNMADLSNLQVLNLHSNCLSTLPESIQHLKVLRVLNLSNNQLKMLPDTIKNLENLHILDISHNQLKELSSVIGNLKFLQELNLQGNKQLSSLPCTLCHATSLRDLHIDIESTKYPSKEISCQGIDAIMKFLAKDAGVEYKSTTLPLEGHSPLLTGYTNDRFQEKIMQLEKLKEIKQRDLLAIALEMDKQQRKEFLLQDALKKTREELQEGLLQHESKMESKILQVQQNHEAERLHLIDNLLEVEKSADEVVSHLLALKGSSDQHLQDVMYLLEQERLAEEELLGSVHQKYESLKHNDVLNAMEAMLEEEYRCEQKLREYEEGRAIATRSLLSLEVDSDKQLGDLLVNQGNAQTELISRIQQDEELQRAAVGALLERGDARSWGLVQQVALVEGQLAALTAVEMKRKNLEMIDQVSDLCEKRVLLSQLLIDLLDQQANRRKELLSTMEVMERARWVSDEDNHDYWLRQYQRLLDSRPGVIAEMERTLDPLLAQNLLLAGVIHCLPLLAQSLQSIDALHSLTNAGLKAAGICLNEDRLAILCAIESYIKERNQSSDASLPEPSAPTETETSKQTIQMSTQDSFIAIEKSECVVCMEEQCELVFVPCGHMCCCIKCAQELKICPLCRAEVKQKIRVILP